MLGVTGGVIAGGIKFKKEAGDLIGKAAAAVEKLGKK